jgi:7,8-dihydropterin-6-yl-methyl-4-(beta-D-ribofuranosyl)aminobenzene 5'-phosphate synthase
MSRSKWTLRILVNNWVGEGSCIAEHGLSIAVEGGDLPEGQFVLFDTGKSPEILFNNARAMKLDWGRLRQIVLSHSHYDHSGSLAGLRQLLDHPVPVLVHPDTFTPKASCKPAHRDIGIPFTRAQLDSPPFSLVDVSADTPITPSFFVTGGIERIFDFEALSHKDLLKSRVGGYVPDTVADDRALVIREPGVGFHLICGCCHSGLLNTLAHAAAASGERQALTITGGLHFGAYDASTLDRVCDRLAEWAPRRIVPLHCTGLKGAAHLWKRFGDVVEFRGAGEEIALP